MFALVGLCVVPPPESKRRPHPYHGTTRNHCADRRFPRSHVTVEAKDKRSLNAQGYVLSRCRFVKCPVHCPSPMTHQLLCLRNGRGGAIRHGRNRAAPPEAARRHPPGPSTARGMSRLTAEDASGKPERALRLRDWTLSRGDWSVVSS